MHYAGGSYRYYDSHQSVVNVSVRHPRLVYNWRLRSTPRWRALTGNSADGSASYDTL